MNTQALDEASFESAWEIARKIYYGQYSGKEPPEMDFVGIEDVYKALRQAGSFIATKNGKQGFSTVFYNFVIRLETYGKAIDMFAQTSTMIFAPIWGSLRILIQVRHQISQTKYCL
jgi:hypothetical protein